ncbi:putative mitochondrial protein [Quercus suber]|uniref:Mitochondrial protein n=1 Tax=Quercus suber TaxID=58331 RepID=A0AAW0L169_QUESU
MDLRLLNGVAYGHSWFGRWGYRFWSMDLGVAKHNYNKAIEILTSLELDKIIQDFSNTDQYKEIKQIIRHCRDMSETQLLTIKDLLRFMLIVKSSRAPLQLNSDIAAKINELELKYERDKDRTMGEVGVWDLRF